MQNIFKREQYLNNECSHQEYYRQFVNKGVINFVSRVIGKDNIINSKNLHFNDIPLKYWDSITDSIKCIMNILEFKYATNSKPGFINWSISDGVCIAKCAAEIIREEANKECIANE